MIFGGFQRLTLLDYPGYVACTLFTVGCNFRCPFCHNAPLVTGGKTEQFSSIDILEYLTRRRGVLEGVCVTGGEPLLQAELPAFLQSVKALGYRVKLDTNGSFPARLRELCEAGLVDYVAMDIKNCTEKYAATAGCGEALLSRVEESLDFLLEGHVDYELRTTVAAELHTVQDVEAIAKRIAGAPRYYLQNFVDSGAVIGTGLSPVPREELEKMCLCARRFVPSAAIRGEG